MYYKTQQYLVRSTDFSSSVILQGGCMLQVFQVIYLVTYLVDFLVVVLSVVVLLAVVLLVAYLVAEVGGTAVLEEGKCKTLLSR